MALLLGEEQDQGQDHRALFVLEEGPPRPPPPSWERALLGGAGSSPGEAPSPAPGRPQGGGETWHGTASPGPAHRLLLHPAQIVFPPYSPPYSSPASRPEKAPLSFNRGSSRSSCKIRRASSSFFCLASPSRGRRAFNSLAASSSWAALPSRGPSLAARDRASGARPPPPLRQPRQGPQVRLSSGGRGLPLTLAQRGQQPGELPLHPRVAEQALQLFRQVVHGAAQGLGPNSPRLRSRLWPWGLSSSRRAAWGSERTCSS